MTTIKAKIKAAENAIIRNPYRHHGDAEKDFKDTVKSNIEILIDYISELETKINTLTFELDELNAKIAKKPNRRS